MTHPAIDFLEKINQPKDNSLENIQFSKLLTFKKANPIRLIILYILSCFSQQVNSQSPQQTRSQSVAYQIKAEWFLKLPQYNLDISFIYLERAINCLNGSEVSNYQSLSQANFNLYKHLLRVNITPKIETYFKKARYYFSKIPNKTEATKLLEYDILIIDAEQSSRNGEQSRANNLMLRAF